MKCKYIGPAKDYSGYGEATRHDIAALHAAGVELTLKIPQYTLEIADFGDLGELVTVLDDKPLDYDIVILHTTPNVYSQYVEKGKYHIGRAFWETDKIPEDFAAGLQLVDEIWTGSEFNAQAIRNAGVTKPIKVIPETIDTSLNVKGVQPYVIPNKDTFKFYSIFEWTERKNPTALITAYWQEFEGVKDVSLTIKTYIDNFTPEKRKEIDASLRAIKSRVQLKHYPTIYIYNQLMNRQQIYRFHQTFDCFVSAHRGEGWGIPQMEAMLMGKPIISTNCGGIHEYLTNGENALLVDCNMVPLKQNSRNAQWYTQDQKWADIDISELRLALGAAYQHKEQLKEIGLAGQKLVREKFSLSAVGNLMAKELLKIEKSRLI